MNVEVPGSIFPATAPLEDTSGRSDHFLRDLINQRAYELFEQRGRRHGHEVEDWLEAEREIKHHLGI